MINLLHHSYINKLSHIPSALSMMDYLTVLFKDGWVKKEDKIVIGKPFGAQSYYLIWREFLGLTDIETLGTGVKHDEIDFVDYSEETIGNALGVASGIAMATDDTVWVNLSDASLQMGNTLEAIQFIGQKQLTNIFVTIDWNEMQVTGRTEDIISVNPIKHMFSEYNWNLIECIDGHDRDEITKALKHSQSDEGPTVIIFNTKKGGCSDILNAPEWHYRKIDSVVELLELEKSCVKH